METGKAMSYCQDKWEQPDLALLFDESWSSSLYGITDLSSILQDDILAGQCDPMQQLAIASEPSSILSTPDLSYESSANAITPGSDSSSFRAQAQPDTLFVTDDPSAAINFDTSGMPWLQMADPLFPDESVGGDLVSFDFNTPLGVGIEDDFASRAFPSLDGPDFYAPGASGANVGVATVASNQPLFADVLDEVEGNTKRPPSSKGPHVCSTCFREFKNKGGLSKHEKTHTRPFSCQICGEGKGSKRDTDRHMWAQHPKEAVEMGVPFEQSQCPHCGKTGRSDNMKRHIRTQHRADGVA